MLSKQSFCLETQQSELMMGTYTAWPKEGQHLDLTKQIARASHRIITAGVIMFQLATSYLTLTDAVSGFLN